MRLSVLPAHERNSPTEIMQKRSGRLMDRTQGLDRDWLKITVSPQSCMFHLFARSCHLRHTTRINVRVSRGANNCHIPRQGPAAFKWNQRETVWSLAVLALWQLGPQQLRKLEQRDRSAHDVWTIYQGPVCRQGCADRERRPASHIGHTSPAQDENRMQP